MEKEIIPAAIEYNGAEPGIDAIFLGIYEGELFIDENQIKIIEEENLFQREQQQAKIKSLVILLIILFALVIFYWGAKIFSEKSISILRTPSNLNETGYNDSIKAQYTARQKEDSITDQRAMQAIKAGSQKPLEHCYFDMISDEYNYEINTYASDGNFNSIIILKIIDKKNKREIQSLEISSNADIDCSARSFMNGYNKDVEVEDGDYESLIIQDFNFDGKEDIAVKTDISQSGAIYSFYLKSEGSSYIPDRFLTDSIMHLPTLDLQSKTLKSVVRAGQDIYEKKYGYDRISGWSPISHKAKQL